MGIWSLVGNREELAVFKDESISELKDAEARRSLQKLMYAYHADTDSATVERLMEVVETSLLANPSVIGAVVVRPRPPGAVYLSIVIRGGFPKLQPFLTKELCQVAHQACITIESAPYFRTSGTCIRDVCDF